MTDIGALPARKALRWDLFHALGRIVRTGRRIVVRILEHWPEADVPLRAYPTSKPSPERFDVPSSGQAGTCHADVPENPCLLAQMRCFRSSNSQESSGELSDRPQSRAADDPQ